MSESGAQRSRQATAGDPAERGMRFPTTALRGQFLLSRDRSVAAPPAWPIAWQGGWSLAHCPSLPVRPLVTPGLGSVGWLLGYPILSGRALAAEEQEISIVGAGAVELEAFLADTGGRYLAVVLAPGLTRAYPDPAGSLGAVYCAHHTCLASTGSLIPYCDACADRREFGAIDLLRWNGMFPLGMTGRHEVERLLPDHYLDLERFTVHRFWPSWAIERAASPADLVDEIAAITTSQVEAMARVHPLQVGLTAGQDSRMLLACMRGTLDRARFYTQWLPDRSAEIDRTVAPRLAKRFGLRHCVLPNVEPESEDLDLWLFRTGSSVSEVRGARVVRARRTLGTASIDLMANLGELGRGYWWSLASGEGADSPLSARRLLGPCKLDEMPEGEARIEAWLRGVAHLHPLDQLDLFYLEQRMGTWAGVWPYGYVDSCLFLAFPLVHRRIIAAMLELPHSYRRGGSLMLDVVRRRWPELASIPINTPTVPLRAKWKLRGLRRRMLAAMGGRRP